jgi:hypothetical protein
MRITDNSAYIEDKFGNRIIVNRNNQRLTVSIQLANTALNPKPKYIGDIDMTSRTLIVKRSRVKHLLINRNAYGLNHKLITEATRFDTVRIIDEFSTWNIPREYIVEHGKPLLFTKYCHELQIFITLDQIEQFKEHKEVKEVKQ